jgi:hypothetical protein
MPDQSEAVQEEAVKAPGWYNDPEGVHHRHQAYWDGEKWTGQTRPIPSAVPPHKSEPVTPFYKRTWFLIIALVIGLAAIASALENDIDTQSEAGATATSAIRVTTTEIVAQTTTRVTTARSATPTSLDLDIDIEDIPDSVTELIFVTVIRDYSADKPFNWTDAWSDDELRTFANVTCDAWDSGLTLEAIILTALGVLLDEGWDSETDFDMAGYVIGVGTEAFCPEHSGKIRG